MRKFGRQNHENGGAKTFLAIDDSTGRVLGFYSLAPSSANYEQTPERRNGFPRHAVPGFRLARLATDRGQHGNGLGTQLLLAAALRCIRVASEVGGVALFIVAKTERAAKWYGERGAQRLIGMSANFPVPLVIPIKTLASALRAAGRL